MSEIDELGDLIEVLSIASDGGVDGNEGESVESDGSVPIEETEEAIIAPKAFPSRRNKVSFEMIRHRLDDEDRITKPYMTKYEYSRIRGHRISQLEKGCISFALWPVNETPSSEQIFEYELVQKCIPLIFCRELPNGQAEYWRVCDLQISNLAFG